MSDDNVVVLHPRPRALPPVKLTLRLSGEVVAVVKALAERRGVSITEVFRQALTTESYLDEAMSRGERVLITDGTTTREIRFR